MLSQAADAVRKARHTLRYLLGNVHDFDPSRDAVPLRELPIADRDVLFRVARAAAAARTAHSEYAPYRATAALSRLVSADLSGWFVEASKDRLYADAPAGPRRRAAQTVAAQTLLALLPAYAPVLPHLADDAWRHIPWKGEEESVFLAGWSRTERALQGLLVPAAADPAADDGDRGDRQGNRDADAAADSLSSHYVHGRWRAVDPLSASERFALEGALAARRRLTPALERLRASKSIGASLEAEASLWVEDPALRGGLQMLQESDNGQDDLAHLFQVSRVTLVDAESDLPAAADEAATYLGPLEDADKAHPALGADVAQSRIALAAGPARGSKCLRCWNVTDTVGADHEHPHLCARCVPVVLASTAA